MPESDTFWDFYWEVRLREMDTLGKHEAILTISRLIRRLSQSTGQPVRLLELGCGEGQIIGTLVEAHRQVPGIDNSLGVDYYLPSIQKCRRNYPQMQFIHGDFTDPLLLNQISKFEIVLLVNALHEVFSAAFSSDLEEVDPHTGKARVNQALQGAASRVATGGYLVLFDGLEMPGDIQEMLSIQFHDLPARRLFETFAREYHPFRITYQETGDPMQVRLSRRDFTRYITKSIFLGKKLWETERLESYQYFNIHEFEDAFVRAGLAIREQRTLTMNDEKWNRVVEIKTPGCDFPEEHIMIVAQKVE